MAQIKIRHGVAWAARVLPLVLLVAGCGDDRPAYAPSRPSPRVAAAPAAATPPPSSTPAASSDAPDPLLSGTEPPGTEPPRSDSDDPLLAQPKMPTAHSHWLRGAIVNGRVTVRLNGWPLGDFAAPVDKDITMKCRPGVNTITLTFEPEGDLASANLDVLESEHDPPIAPLATFRTALPTPDAKPQEVTKTLTFIAR